MRPDARLVDVGLTSMDMVNLMLSVEAEFDFTIPQAEITPENFQSVETLERMVDGPAAAARRPEGTSPPLAVIAELGPALGADPRLNETVFACARK